METPKKQGNWTVKDFAGLYVERLDFALIPNKPGTKTPYHNGWQITPPITTPEAALSHWTERPKDGIGAHLGASGLVTLDVDALQETHTALEAVGINIDELLNAPDAVRIEGNPEKAKLLYRFPKDFQPKQTKCLLRWVPLTVFELRTGPNQDLLPPSIHPTGKPYRWLTPMPTSHDAIPYLPQPLRELWENWNEKRTTMLLVCPWYEDLEATEKVAGKTAQQANYSSSGSGDGWDAVRAQIREMLPLPEWLDKIGAQHAGANKFHCPFHPPDSNPSFAVFETNGGHLMWVDFHGDAPVGWIEGGRRS